MKSKNFKVLTAALVMALTTGFTLASKADVDSSVRTLMQDGVLSRTAKYPVQVQEIDKNEGQSVTYQVVIQHALFGEIKLMRRVPVGVRGVHPAIFVLSGAANGMNAVKSIPDQKGVEVVALEYPFNKSNSPLEQGSSLLSNYLKTQAQIVAALFWMMQQRDIDPNRITVLTVSFGTFVVPPALYIATQLGFTPAATVFAFGGSGVENFMDFSQISDANLREQIKNNIRHVFAQVDGRQFLKNLKGPFLLIRGKQDEVVPDSATQSLLTALAEPKKLIELDTPHINSDKVNVIEETLKAVMPWLQEQGAI